MLGLQKNYQIYPSVSVIFFPSLPLRVILPKKSINIFKAPMKPLKKRQLSAKFYKCQYIYSKNVIVSQISTSAIINTIP